MANRAAWTLGAVLVTGGAVLGARHVVAPDPAVVARRIVVPTPPPAILTADTLERGETLAELLADNGFEGSGSLEVIEVVRAYKNPRRLRPGASVEFAQRLDEPPHRMSMKLNPDSTLLLEVEDSVWTADLELTPVTTDTLLLSGVIETSLWFAKLGGEVEKLAAGEFQDYVYDLADVFAWKLDFTRDIREGDQFRVAVERERRPDGSLRSRRFMVIELINRGNTLPAIPFVWGSEMREYYDADGKALRGAFLRYPVPFRVTSNFNRRRYHPILKRRRPHLGTDYGAPTGTRIKATAAGRVTRAGTWGGYGRMVELSHSRGIVTRYAHLSRIGVRVGQYVDQEDIIGRVGATGLATAPHLHYEFLQNGRQTNPATVKLPPAKALDSEQLPAFAGVRETALELLAMIPVPDQVAPPPSEPPSEPAIERTAAAMNSPAR
ncbi:MAG: peptidoglycan DD-metalloendopeptidase family protein [Gemmatimonadota bacterium]